MLKDFRVTESVAFVLSKLEQFFRPSLNSPVNLLVTPACQRSRSVA